MDDLESVVDALSRDEPEWLRTVRRKAFEAFTRTPLALPRDSPTVKQYTKVTEEDLVSFPFNRGGGGDGARGSPLRKDRLVVADLHDPDTLDAFPDVIRKNFFSVLEPAGDKFAMMNAAFWAAGTFVHVPEGVKARLPVRLVQPAGSVDGKAVVSRTLVVAEKDSSLTLIEDISRGDAAGLASSFVEVVVGEGARVDICSIQDPGPELLSISRSRAMVGGNGTVRWFPAHFGGKWSIVRVESVLAGRGARSETWGAFLCSGSEHLDLSNNTVHMVPATSNTIFTRGIMLESSASVYRGNIEIMQEARGTASQMKEETLLLSREAHANAIPSLTIRTNEVTAKHAASVSNLDESQIYYLMTRGLARHEAERLIVDGFYSPITIKVPDQGFRSRLQERVSCGLHKIGAEN